MPKWESRIFEQARQLNIDESIAAFYWKALSDSASYSFNKSHSLAYAYMAAKTVWLKCNHPKEFFLALLETAQKDNESIEAISAIAKELDAYGLQLLPPDLEKSSMEFTIEGESAIRYGLSAIKGISEKTVSPLSEFVKYRGELANKYDVFNAAANAKLNISVLCALIQAGTLSGYPGGRPRLVLEAQTWNLLTDREKKNMMRLGPEYNYDLLQCIADCHEQSKVGDNGKPIFSASRFQTFKKKFETYRDIYIENRKNEELCNWWFETSLLGYVYSSCLARAFESSYGHIDTAKEIADKGKGEIVKFAGKIIECVRNKSKNDNVYVRVLLDDGRGQVTGIMMDNRKRTVLSDFLSSHDNKLPSKDSIAIMIGKKGDGNSSSIFVDSFAVINTSILMRVADLKKIKI
jgi:DNA polymerase III alpha subunit